MKLNLGRKNLHVELKVMARHIDEILAEYVKTWSSDLHPENVSSKDGNMSLFFK